MLVRVKGLSHNGWKGKQNVENFGCSDTESSDSQLRLGRMSHGGNMGRRKQLCT